MRAVPGSAMVLPVASALYAISVLVLVSGATMSRMEMTCESCPDGLFLNQTSLSCAACPDNSRVADPANASSVLECACEAGYANGSTACAPCALGRYKPSLGNVTCTACPVNTNTTGEARVALDECLCAPGFFFGSVPATVTSFVNVARACGAAQNAACPVQFPSVLAGYNPIRGNDNDLNVMLLGGGAASTTHFFRIDFGVSRQLSHITFYNRNSCCGDRSNNAQIRVGSSNL